MTNGQAIVPAIVIEGTREYWPGGPQTFRALPAAESRTMTLSGSAPS